MKALKMLAIDLGASSGRGIVGQFDGKKLSLTENHRFPNEPVNTAGHFCWDILRIFHEIKSSILKCSLSGDRDIKSIGIDTWGVDYAYLDKNGALLANPYHYRDSRTEGIQDYAFSKVPFNEIYGVTGIQTVNFNTIYQLIADLRDRPEVVAAADKMLFTPDLLNYFLTGEKFTEYTIASTGAVLDAAKYDIAYGLLNKFGINTNLFSPVVMPGHHVGKLTPALHEELGGIEAEVVNIAAHDTASAVIAVPATGKDFVYISSGTWSLMGTELDAPIINEASLKYNFTNEGGAGKTIRFLKNIMGLWLEQESRRQWRREGKEVSFDELSRAAAAVTPLACIINPDDDSFTAPGNMPRRIAEYCKKTGQHVPETMGEIVRCIFDSLALRYRWTIEKMEEITGKKYQFINIVGGGTQEKMLCQFAADACGIPVYAGPVEATAIGNISMQAIAAGELANITEAREVIRRSFEIKYYEPHRSEAWDLAYEKFKALCGDQ